MSEEAMTIRRGQGVGYLCRDGHIGMIRCFKCGRENWCIAVPSGRCAWCGFDANVKEDEPKASVPT